jgi:hypothetical protein
MDTTDLEDNRENTKSAAEHLQVTKKEAAVKIIEATVGRYGDRYVAVERHRELEKRTQGEAGSWKILVAARRRTTCLTQTVRRNERANKGLTVA